MNIYKAILFTSIGGLILTASWPTYGFFPLVFFGLIPFLYVNEFYRGKNIFLIFFIGFLSWNLTTTYWLSYATIFGYLFACFVNSLMMTCIFYFFRKLKNKTNEKLGFIFLISLWICYEKLHLIWDFSWPWLIFGNVFSENTWIIQWYEYTGVFGGTLWVLTLNIFFFKIYSNYLIGKKNNSLIYSQISFFLIPTLISLYTYNNYEEVGEIKNISIVQPNVDPYSKKYNITNDDNFNYLTEIIESNNIKNSLILFPETFFSEGVQINSIYYNNLSKKVHDLNQKYNNEIMSGIELYEIIYDSTQLKNYSNKIRENRWINIYNSAIYFGKSTDYYHKSKLVVGVEKMPYRNILEPILGKVLLDFGGLTLTRGEQKYRTSFKSSNYNPSPIICYESIYGQYVTDYIKSGGKVLAIITNDAWWDYTEGHRQHFSYAKLRAVETRKNIIRSANTGISGIINSKGNSVLKSDYDQEVVISGKYSENEVITFYVKYGDLIYRLSLFFVLMIFSYFLSLTISPRK